MSFKHEKRKKKNYQINEAFGTGLNTILECRKKVKQRNDKERMIQWEYEEATRHFEKDPSDYNKSRLNEIKEKLELFYEEKTNGIIVRARARWHEHGERSTKYFLNLDKRNHVKKHIRKLVISGAITTDPYQILPEQKKFHYNLYNTKAVDKDAVQSFLKNLCTAIV